MGKNFNFGTNKQHEKAVNFVINNHIEPSYIGEMNKGELPYDIIVHPVNNREVLCYIAVIKMTKSSRYGATTLCEWRFAYSHEDNFFFAIVIGDCESQETTDVYFLTPRQMCDISLLPPFYYKCSVPKKRMTGYSREIHYERFKHATNNESYTPIEGGTHPSKVNTRRAEIFFKKLSEK